MTSRDRVQLKTIRRAVGPVEAGSLTGRLEVRPPAIRPLEADGLAAGGDRA